MRGLSSAIRNRLRSIISIPTGSIFWIDVDNEWYSPDEITPEIKKQIVEMKGLLPVHLDTPKEDLIESFDLPIGAICEELSVPKVRKKAYRDQLIQINGEQAILNVERLVNEFSVECIEYFQSLYQIDLPEIDVMVRWHSGRSTGGRNGISVGVGYLYASKHVFRFHFEEYKSISKDEDIGDFWSGARDDHVKALVAHEVAHFIQDNTKGSGLPVLDYKKPHGNGWQFIYRTLRKKLNAEMKDKW